MCLTLFGRKKNNYWEGFGYELTKFQVRLNNRTESKTVYK